MTGEKNETGRLNADLFPYAPSDQSPHNIPAKHFCRMTFRDYCARRLSAMSLEELWQLFPVEIVPHRSEWSQWASEEIAFLANALGTLSPVSITHIGSTAVEGLSAKPVVDLLVELPYNFDRSHSTRLIEEAGYILMSTSTARMSFNKGYTPWGYANRVFHLHIHQAGDNDEIRFRDILRAHPEVARNYEALKLSLLPHFRNDRDGYTAAKTKFITDTLHRYHP